MGGSLPGLPRQPRRRGAAARAHAQRAAAGTPRPLRTLALAELARARPRRGRRALGQRAAVLLRHAARRTRHGGQRAPSRAASVDRQRARQRARERAPHGTRQPPRGRAHQPARLERHGALAAAGRQPERRPARSDASIARLQKGALPRWSGLGALTGD